MGYEMRSLDLMKQMTADGEKDYSERIELYENYRQFFSENFWGFDVPDAWMYAVRRFLELAEFHSRQNYVVTIFQIKEKFRQLRIYAEVNSEDDNILTGMISYVKSITDHTCSKCGKMQKELRTNEGWITYLCDECYEEKRNENL